MNPTALSATNTADEGQNVLFFRGTKRGPMESLTVDELRTPLEKRSKKSENAATHPYIDDGLTTATGWAQDEIKLCSVS